MGEAFPSMKARALLALLQREPLAYRVIRCAGSHRVLRSVHGYPQLTLSFHEGVSVGGTMVRKILMRDIGLTEAEALALVRRGGRP